MITVNYPRCGIPAPPTFIAHGFATNGESVAVVLIHGGGITLGTPVGSSDPTNWRFKFGNIHEGIALMIVTDLKSPFLAVRTMMLHITSDLNGKLNFTGTTTAEELSRPPKKSKKKKSSKVGEPGNLSIFDPDSSFSSYRNSNNRILVQGYCDGNTIDISADDKTFITSATGGPFWNCNVTEQPNAGTVGYFSVEIEVPGDLSNPHNVKVTDDIPDFGTANGITIE